MNKLFIAQNSIKLKTKIQLDIINTGPEEVGTLQFTKNGTVVYSCAIKNTDTAIYAPVDLKGTRVSLVSDNYHANDYYSAAGNSQAIWEDFEFNNSKIFIYYEPKAHYIIWIPQDMRAQYPVGQLATMLSVGNKMWSYENEEYLGIIPAGYYTSYITIPYLPTEFGATETNLPDMTYTSEDNQEYATNEGWVVDSDFCQGAFPKMEHENCASTGNIQWN